MHRNSMNVEIAKNSTAIFFLIVIKLKIGRIITTNITQSTTTKTKKKLGVQIQETNISPLV